MWKSIIAGLTLSAALGLAAGQALADPDNKDSAAPAARAHARKPATARRTAETPAPLFRIPAHPVVRDCVHVMFPQCSRGFDPLNDGTHER
jgi:hypothetical protein